MLHALAPAPGSRSRGLWTAALALVAFLSAAPARAQTVRPEVCVTDGDVRAMVEAGGTLYFGGSFDRVGPATGAWVRLDAASGLASFPNPRFEGGFVFAAAPDGSGGWYVGGSFTSVNGLACPRLAHVLADGSRAAWSPAPDGTVYALAVGAAGVYVGGRFDNVGGQPRANLALVDAATGNAISSWNPGVNDRVNVLALRGGLLYAGGRFSAPRLGVAALDAATGAPTGWAPFVGGFPVIDALAFNGNTVFLGGSFTIFSGSSRQNLMAVSATGPGFPTTWNPSANGPAYALLYDAGRVFVGGAFTMIGGRSLTGLAAVDTLAGSAGGWSPGANNTVSALSLGGSTLYAAGSFTSLGGQSRRSLAALDTSTASPLATAWNPGANSVATVIAAAGAQVFAGGAFTIAGGLVRHGLAALDVASGQATAWDPNASGGAVNALASAGGVVYAGGTFTSVGGQLRDRVAALDAASGAATDWNPGANGAVSSIAVSGATVFLGGQFTSVGGPPRNSIASVAAAGGTTGWNPNLTGGAAPDVAALATAGTNVFAGGSYLFVGGQPHACLVGLDAGDGTVAWDPFFNSGVGALSVAEGLLYSGLKLGPGVGPGADRLVALDLATAHPTDRHPGVDGDVLALAASGGTLYVGGGFDAVGGIPRARVAAIEVASARATSWNPAANDTVHAIVVAGGTVFVAGRFTSIGGRGQSGLAGLTNDGLASVREAEPPPLELLATNRPNPFAEATTIRFTLPSSGPVTLLVHDVRGGLVASLMERRSVAAGPHEVRFARSGLPPGIYFATLEACGRRSTRRMALVR